MSIITGLDDEIDEWAALNKYAVYRNFQDNLEKKLLAHERKQMMRDELQQQQREFRRRQELFKIDQMNFLKEQQARNQIQDQIDKNRREDKLRKL